jgi:hypothetical protein
MGFFKRRGQGSSLSEREVSPDGTYRLTLGREATETVKEVMRRSRASTIQEAMGQALSDKLFLLQHQADGWDVVLIRGSESRKINWPAPKCDA